jgi:hypothetical protein
MSRLTIYVAGSGCVPCGRARELGRTVAAEYPSIDVEVIDLATVPPGEVPDAVVAVPTYLLDGAVISMGNPRESTLREKLAASAAAGG